MMNAMDEKWQYMPMRSFKREELRTHNLASRMKSWLRGSTAVTNEAKQHMGHTKPGLAELIR